MKRLVFRDYAKKETFSFAVSGNNGTELRPIEIEHPTTQTLETKYLLTLDVIGIRRWT